jgi:hypothetical protein
MTGNEWWNAPHPARRHKNGGSMGRSIIGGFVGAIVVAIVAVLWNSYSEGGLIRALGGATSAELVVEAAKHPGPAGLPGPAGPPGPVGPPGSPVSAGAASAISLISQGSVDFDGSGAVPGSEAASLCTLSKIAVRRYGAHPDRSCELTPGAQRGDPWHVTVDGAICGVTCFATGTQK